MQERMMTRTERARRAAEARAAIANATEALSACNALTVALVGIDHEDVDLASDLLAAADAVAVRLLRYEVLCLRSASPDGTHELPSWEDIETGPEVSA